MKGKSSGADPTSLMSARKSVIETFQDEILKFLLENSNMTRKQFETFLIDSLADNLLEDELTSTKRPKLRTDRDSLSRGSFDRTLIQSKRNIVEAIFTVLLLGYVGLLDTPQLEPFLEVGRRLKDYVESRGTQNMNEELEIRRNLSRELSEILGRLVKARKKIVPDLQ